MKLKPEILEKIINDSIRDVGQSRWDNEEFAIYEDTRVQVQIKVTREKVNF